MNKFVLFSIFLFGVPFSTSLFGESVVITMTPSKVVTAAVTTSWGDRIIRNVYSKDSLITQITYERYYRGNNGSDPDETLNFYPPDEYVSKRFGAGERAKVLFMQTKAMFDGQPIYP